MPKNFGGLGGLSKGRGLNKDDAFEMTVNRVLGDRIRADMKVACDMWSALANVEWYHKDGDNAGYSFRAAGDLVAAIYGQGTDYMTFYCSGPYATVSTEIAEALRKEGWTYEIM